MLLNFSFVIENELAGSALPGTWAPLPEDLREARAEGITAVISLTENPLNRAVVEEAGMQYLHLPIEDFQPPSLGQIERFVAFVDEVRSGGGAVLVHCRAGIGRTGTMLTAYLVKEGMSAPDALEEVRRLRPGSVETRGQVAAIRDYQEHLRAQRKN